MLGLGVPLLSEHSSKLWMRTNAMFCGVYGHSCAVLGSHGRLAVSSYFFELARRKTH